MDRHVRIFRLFIIGSLVLGVAGAILDLIFPSLLPEILEDSWEAYTLQGDAWTTIAISGGVAVVFLMIGIVAAVGLLMLKLWARPVGLWFTILSLLAYPLFGAVLQSSWAAMLTEASTLMCAAALTMAYCSDLRVKFGDDR